MTPTSQRRRGALTVETAMVISLAFLLLFGIFEYARFLFFLQVADNAAREGGRYACCNTNRNVSLGSSTDTAAPNRQKPNGTWHFDADTDPTTPPSICGVVNYFMKGRQNDLTGYNVTAYSADPATGNNIGTWKDAPFAGAIGVQLTGTYQFLVPQLLGMSSGTIPINIRVLVNSEAN